MKIFLLTFYFFCWTTIRIDVLLATQRTDGNEEDQVVEHGNKTKHKLPKVIMEHTGIADVSCQLSERMERIHILQNDEIYSSLGPRENVLIMFENLLSSCPLSNLIFSNISTVKMEELLEPVNRQVMSLSAAVLQRTEDNKSKLLHILPMLNNSQKVILRDQYESYKQLNWSYANNKIVHQADEITDNLIWPEQKVPSDDVLNDRMYNVLNAELCQMKKQLEDSEGMLSLAKKLHNFLTNSHVFMTAKPFCTIDDLENDPLFKAHNAILSCQRQLQFLSSSADLPHSLDSLDNVIASVTQWLHRINQQILKQVEMLKNSLQSVSDEQDEYLLENLAAQHYINADNKFNALKFELCKEENASKFGKIINNLTKLYALAPRANSFFCDMQKKIYKDLNMEIQLRKSFTQIKKERKKDKIPVYQAIVTYTLNINSMKVYKGYAENILHVLECVRDNLINITYECTEKNTYTVPFNNIITVYDLMQRLQEPFTRISWLSNTVRLNIRLNDVIKTYEKYHSKIRMLQYLWSSACLISKNVMKDEKYIMDQTKRKDALRYIALFLYISVLTIEELHEDKNDL